MVRPGLYLLSRVYEAVVRLISGYSLRNARALPCPAISIGNITVGGTGKTTLVECVARYLESKGHHVAILSRGYSKKAQGGDRGGQCADEPQLLQEHLPGVAVVVDPDRYRGALRARNEFAADTVVLDDGFQQWKFRKDLEIVVVDATNPFGNRHLLPRGILREPLDALSRADVFVITKANCTDGTQWLKDCLAVKNPVALIVETRHAAEIFVPCVPYGGHKSVESMRSKKAFVFSGIGDPRSFEQLVCSLGIEIVVAERFDDHHPYTVEEIKGIFSRAAACGAEVVLTTEKDAVRCKGSGVAAHTLEMFALRIHLEFLSDEKEFFRRLDRVYSR